MGFFRVFKVSGNSIGGTIPTTVSAMTALEYVFSAGLGLVLVPVTVPVRAASVMLVFAVR